ncbi:putative aliphatic sulfonates transport permease protein SsuC [Caprobacter fermentans]|uniref:Putative aliphatic sulfonates transport permease protein SsuC n=1 Tax=Caproicibacter fermentans TaxID=2576756 RepID=A0A6N8I239_9FIRM|nr:putative aliphatic sulfonates transport permease protein SsuC [Caproicibacter fermentans]
MKRLRKRCRTFLEGFLLINLIWLTAHFLFHITVIPNPIDVYRNSGTLIADRIGIHILYSLWRIAAGLALSLLVGVPVGMLMGYSVRANRILYPLIYFSYPIPKTALLPVAMLLWGMRDGSKIAIIFLIIVFQVIVSVRDGIGQIDPVMYLVTVSAGATRAQIVRHVALPAILPELLTSVRISLGTALSILFFVEGYGTKYGMGYYILDAWSRIDYTGMYLGILVISVIGFALLAGVDLLSDRLCVWSRKQQE